MKTAVLGGAGFVGSHLCEALLARGHSVACLDNLITGDRANIQALEGRTDFRFVCQDVIQPFTVEAEAIFQLASPASPIGYRTYPIETLLVNSVGTYNALQEAKRQNARFLMASTSECYGDPQVHPQVESYWGNVNPVGVRACYDEAKRFAEAITMEFVRSFDLDARIIRIFNTYGPRNQSDDGRVVPNFINQAIYNQPLTVFGDGSQTRSFCYVADLVEGIQRALFTEGTKGEVINLGNPSEYTILQFAELTKRLAGSDSEIVFETLPEGRTDDPGRRRPDITKARQLLGWEPQVSVEDGIRRTIAWYREHRPGL